MSLESVGDADRRSFPATDLPSTSQAGENAEQLRSLTEQMKHTSSAQAALQAFAQHTHKILQDLLDISVLLLPNAAAGGTDASRKNQKRRSGAPAAQSSAEPAPAGTGLKWENVCWYRLSYYAAEGPHWVDWEEVHRQGGASMITLPLATSESAESPVIGALTLVSTCKAAFTDGRLLSMLAATAVPFLLRLPTVLTKGPAQAAMLSLLPQLLKQEQERLWPEDDDSSELPSASEKSTELCDWLWNLMRDPPQSEDEALQPLAPQNLDSDDTGVANNYRSWRNRNGDDTDDGYWRDAIHFVISSCLCMSYYQNNFAEREKSILPKGFVYLLAFVDLAYLLLRFFTSTSCITPGTSLHSLFATTRMMVLPAANSWLTWRVSGNTMRDFATSTWITTCLVGMAGCLTFGIKERFLLHAPLQVFTLLLTTLTMPQICGAFACQGTMMCFVLAGAAQFLFAEVLPSMITFMVDCRPSGMTSLHSSAPLRPWLARHSSSLT
ncbi:hypothetical protein WJX73_002192 [Symbiochloris irregularis]|uniref:Uncharacterized protein n=1 Tax=Symbiochloris irregularis TaxID=706552 RepID=A0AAW1NWX4_9CHLO